MTARDDAIDAIRIALMDDENLWSDPTIAYTYWERAKNAFDALLASGCVLSDELEQVENTDSDTMGVDK